MVGARTGSGEQGCNILTSNQSAVAASVFCTQHRRSVMTVIKSLDSSAWLLKSAAASLVSHYVNVLGRGLRPISEPGLSLQKQACVDLIISNAGDSIERRRTKDFAIPRWDEEPDSVKCKVHHQRLGLRRASRWWSSTSALCRLYRLDGETVSVIESSPLQPTALAAIPLSKLTSQSQDHSLELLTPPGNQSSFSGVCTSRSGMERREWGRRSSAGRRSRAALCRLATSLCLCD